MEIKNQRHFVEISEIENLTLEECNDFLKNHRWISFADLRIRDLVFCGNKPIMQTNGVYLFLDAKGAIKYVGKSGSRSMVERIPSHFDLRPKSWFNTFLKKKAGANNKSSLAKAAKAIFDQYRLIYILFPNNARNKKRLGKLEKYLQVINRDSVLNSVRRIKPLSDLEMQSPVSQLIAAKRS